MHAYRPLFESVRGWNLVCAVRGESPTVFEAGMLHSVEREATLQEPQADLVSNGLLDVWRQVLWPTCLLTLPSVRDGPGVATRVVVPEVARATPIVALGPLAQLALVVKCPLQTLILPAALADTDRDEPLADLRCLRPCRLGPLLALQPPLSDDITAVCDVPMPIRKSLTIPSQPGMLERGSQVASESGSPSHAIRYCATPASLRSPKTARAGHRPRATPPASASSSTESSRR
eukprot:GHVU01112791.1.p2 GENE.GHVU01112791.1~~GHVU01112791.1.p2  ORF type:complete len:233 (-),score=3.08 GHVU01112791.1:1127-1825(-)